MSEPGALRGSGEDGTPDAELVAGVLAGNRDDFAAVYDRYGDRLHDFAHSMLRQREEAEDAVADSFVTMAERLAQLRDPDRLRPWLYAIVRSECLRRLKARTRIAHGGDEQLVDMADGAASPESEVELNALRTLVWDASAGLAERDRSLLDLHLRHGLEGAELGEAMGVSANNAYVMLSRVRTQVERSLGALLIARLGRDDCEELDTVLADWDGTFSPLIRKRVARHVDDCDVCSERKRVMVSPVSLFSGVPLIPAPLSLRDRVLETQLVSSTGPDDGGGAGSALLSGRRLVAVLAAGVAAVVALGAVLLWPGGAEDDPTTPTTAAQQTDAAPAPTETPATPSPTPSESLGTPGTIEVSTQVLDLGAAKTSASLRLTNAGDRPVGFRVGTSIAWLSVSPVAGELAGGQSTNVRVTADRSGLAEGASVGNVSVVWDGGSAPVTVRLTTKTPPTVGRPTVLRTVCTQGGRTVVVSASASDDSGVESVVLTYSGPSGAGSRTMTRSDNGWTGAIGPLPVGGTLTMRATATDRRGTSARSATTRTSVDPCPQ